MIILALDPGQTIGFCCYDTVARVVLAHGEINADSIGNPWLAQMVAEYKPGVVAIERPRVYSSRGKDGVIKHASGNDVADCCEQAGWLLAMAGGTLNGVDRGNGRWQHATAMAMSVYMLERRAVTHAFRRHFGEPIVGDAALWNALKAMHGPEATQTAKAGKAATKRAEAVPERLAGHMASMGGHARAALALAVAVSLG